MKDSIFYILVVFLFCCCEKKELPAPKYNRGDVLTAQVEMTGNYKNQVWFSLSANKVVSINAKTMWDLAFESSTEGFRILLNTSKAMKVFRTNFTALEQVKDTAGLELNGKTDAPSGHPDSTGIGDWRPTQPVYVINRGYDELGLHKGYYKLKIKSVNSGWFYFEYADIFGTQTFNGTIIKDPDYQYNMYSFSQQSQLAIEPKKTEYDLCFTQYTHVFNNPLMLYQVTGVLSNGYNTRVARITDKEFKDIRIEDTVNCKFSANKDRIGYEWKSFNLGNNLFTVDPKMCYLLRDNKGFYYKLHFVDFYNQDGIKGYPKFEFKKL